GPSICTVAACAGSVIMPGPALTRRTLTIWRGSAAVPPNRSVESTLVIRMGSCSHLLARAPNHSSTAAATSTRSGLLPPAAGSQSPQRLTSQPVHRPFVHRPRPESGVEAQSWLVPVQHPPFQPSVAALDAKGSKLGEQCLTEALAAHLGADVQVFQV